MKKSKLQTVNNKYKSLVKKAVIGSLELSAELLEMAHGDKNYLLYSAASKDCKTCYGRGYNEISHPLSTKIRKVPCDCAMHKAQKTMNGKDTRPAWAVTKGAVRTEVHTKTFKEICRNAENRIAETA